MRTDRSYIYEQLRMLKSDIERARELTEKLNSIAYKSTASYGLNAGGGGGMPSNQIERLILKKERLQYEIDCLNSRIRGYNEAIIRLTPLERDVVYVIIDGGKLSHYARQKGIYKSTIYKISDKAIDKIAEYIERG